MEGATERGMRERPGEGKGFTRKYIKAVAKWKSEVLSFASTGKSWESSLAETWNVSRGWTRRR